MIARRSFLAGIIGAAIAPAIIRTPGLLMPVKARRTDALAEFARRVLNPTVERHIRDIERAALFGDDALVPQEFSGFATFYGQVPEPGDTIKINGTTHLFSWDSVRQHLVYGN